MMKCGASVALVLVAVWPQVASAQQALNAAEQQGQQLFLQSCGVCHLKPQITSQTFGPTLSKETIGDRAQVIHDVIANGTPRMPGFKLTLEPAQIDAIIAYLKTVPAPPPAPAAPAQPAR